MKTISQEYLTKFGYIDPGNLTRVLSDVNIMKNAITEFQTLAGINQTGKCVILPNSSEYH